MLYEDSTVPCNDASFKVLIFVTHNVFRLIGGVGQGSIPWVLVGSVAFIFVLLRYVSILMVSSTQQDKNKGVCMVATLKARARFLFSSMFETIWATGVGYAAGHLST